jgi:hypothetical protein
MKKKPLTFFLFFAAVIILTIFFLRFVLGGGEDSWICTNGKWTKHGYPNSPKPTAGCEEELIGGERDKHGCLGPAGYSWCEEKKKCLRVWEEPCE